jgi:hypothetical protein
MKPLKILLAELYQIGFGHRTGMSALSDLSEVIEKKLGPAAEEYDETAQYVVELEQENAELRGRLAAYERGVAV